MNIDEHISKTKDRKIDFSFASEHFSNFINQKKNQLFLRGEGRGDSVN